MFAQSWNVKHLAQFDIPASIWQNLSFHLKVDIPNLFAFFKFEPIEKWWNVPFISL